MALVCSKQGFLRSVLSSSFLTLCGKREATAAAAATEDEEEDGTNTKVREVEMRGEGRTKLEEGRREN